MLRGDALPRAGWGWRESLLGSAQFPATGTLVVARAGAPEGQPGSSGGTTGACLALIRRVKSGPRCDIWRLKRLCFLFFCSSLIFNPVLSQRSWFLGRRTGLRRALRRLFRCIPVRSNSRVDQRGCSRWLRSSASPAHGNKEAPATKATGFCNLL